MTEKLNATPHPFLSKLTDERLKEVAEETYQDLQVAIDRVADAKQHAEFLESWLFKAQTEMIKRGIKRDNTKTS